MKKSQIFTIVTCSIAALLLSGVLIVGLSGDGFHFEAAAATPKTHQNQMDIDLEETSVTGLDIYWVDGAVEVVQSPDGGVHVIERSQAALDPADQMEVSVSGGILSVKWNGQWLNKLSKWINLGWLQRGSKDLTVQLPAAVAAQLKDLKAATTSGDITLGLACQAASAEFSTTSGRLTFSSLAVEETLSASSVSGDIRLQNAQCRELAINTTSGKLQLEGVMAQEVSVSSTSGDCQYTGAVDQLQMNTVSGRMTAELSACPEKSEMSSVSGSLTLSIPENPGFTVEHSTVSGTFDSDFPLSQLGKQGHMSYAAGTGLLHFSTTSGGVSIQRR